MPQNPDIIAGASSDGAIYIFDRTKHGSTRIRQSKISHPFETKLFGSHGVIQDVEAMDTSSADINEATSLAWNLQQEALYFLLTPTAKFKFGTLNNIRMRTL